MLHHFPFNSYVQLIMYLYPLQIFSYRYFRSCKYYSPYWCERGKVLFIRKYMSVIYADWLIVLLVGLVVLCSLSPAWWLVVAGQTCLGSGWWLLRSHYIFHTLWMGQTQKDITDGKWKKQLIFYVMLYCFYEFIKRRQKSG